jgi:hypothetical protein
MARAGHLIGCVAISTRHADDVKESKMATRPTIFKWRRTERRSFSVRCAGIFAILYRCGCRGATGRAWPGRRSYNGLALGAALRPGVRAAIAPVPQADKLCAQAAGPSSRARAGVQLALHIPSLHCAEGKVNGDEADNHHPEHDQVVQHNRSSCRAARPRAVSRTTYSRQLASPKNRLASQDADERARRQE